MTPQKGGALTAQLLPLPECPLPPGADLLPAGGGRLRAFAARFKAAGLDAHACRLAEGGQRLPLVDRASFKAHAPFDSAKVLSAPDADRIRVLLPQMLERGDLEPCAPPTQAQLDAGQVHYALLFPRVKPSGRGDRPCYNGKPLNAHLRAEHFRLESIHDGLRQIGRGWYMAKVDIENAFPHLAMHESARDLLRVIVDGEHYRFSAANFGLATTPRTFTRVLAPIVARLRREGARLVWYIDDFLVLGPSRDSVRFWTRRLLETLRYFGFSVNEAKCELEPSQSMEFLGLTIDTRAMELQLPTRKLRDIRRDARRLLSAAEAGRPVRARALAGLLGKTQAATPAIPELRDTTWALGAQKARLVRPSASYDASEPLSAHCAGELRAMLSRLDGHTGRSILTLSPEMAMRFATAKPVTLHPVTDASPWAWGAVLEQEGGETLSARGSFSRSVAASSQNNREMTGAILALKGFARHRLREAAAQGRLPSRDVPWIVDLETDNSTVVSYLNSKATRAHHLHRAAASLRRWLAKRHMVLRARHRPGVDNEAADALSRVVFDSTDWSLDHLAFVQTVVTFGRPTVDLFASHADTKLPRFFSRFPDPKAAATDAFRQDWGAETLGYACPPPALIHKILSKVEADKAEIILIAPDWARSWLPRLRELAVAPPIPLISWRLDDCVAAPGPMAPKPFAPASWRFLAWRLSGADT